MTPPAPQPAAPACLPVPQNIKSARVLSAAAQLLPSLERGSALDARLLREAMTAAFEGSDQDGAWLWKDAYEASEAAAVLFLRKYGSGMLKKAASAARYLSMLERLAALLPSHTRRSEESDQFQQFSTPLGLGFLLSLAAQVRPGEIVLEPSAGTGLLAIHAEIAGAALALNELAETRQAMLAALFQQVPVMRFNAEQIDDYLDASVTPDCVLMNPPFSASPNIERSMRDTTVRHIRSALRRVADGGRLVVLTGASHDPLNADIRALYADLTGMASFRFTATVDGRIYARHGTSIDTRLTVIDRIPKTSGSTLIEAGHAGSLAELLALIETKLPPRPFPATAERVVAVPRRATAQAPVRPRSNAPSVFPAPQELPQSAAEIIYEPREATAAEATFSDRIYEPYQVQSIRLPAQSRIRQNSCNRRPWLPSGRPFPPTGRCCQGS